jgi:hypothetical protein
MNRICVKYVKTCSKDVESYEMWYGGKIVAVEYRIR